MRRWVVVTVALLAGACGRIDFDDLGDAGAGGDATPYSLAQDAYLKASNTDANDQFGYAVAVSDDGSTLAVGAPKEQSAALGIDGNQADNTLVNAGAVYVFTRVGATWAQQAYVKASNTDAGDRFGGVVSLSADGSILAVGAFGEASAATGVDGNQADNSRFAAGAAYVFTRAGTTWTQQAYIKASNPDQLDAFGIVIALSSDGSTLAVGAPSEASAATGIDGDQADNTAPAAGAVYVFAQNAGTWAQQAYVKASNTDSGDDFGFFVALSATGSTLAVGAENEASAAAGVDGNQADNSADRAGAVYVFDRAGTTWSQSAYLKASNTDAGDTFGYALVLSGDGNTLAVGAPGESSAAIGIGGDQTDNSAAGAGAAYVFARAAGWSQQAYVKASNTDAGDEFGESIGLSANGSVLVVGALLEASAGRGIGADQSDNSMPMTGAAYLFTRSATTWSQQVYIKSSNAEAPDQFGTYFVGLSSDGSTLAVAAFGEASDATGVDGDQSDNSAVSAGAVYVFH